jgi:hypothetical protein
MDNKELHDFYNKYSNIFLGTKTQQDAYLLLDKLKLSKLQRNMILSIIYSKKYDSQAIDIKQLIEYMRDLDNCKYREEAYLKLQDIIKFTSQIPQIKSLTRIANSKPLKPTNIRFKDLLNTVSTELISKKCVHCAGLCYGTLNTDYMICGFNENGYDWEGCGHDWCFKCGGMLCKSWENDKLFIPINQVHDNSCCKKHAQIFNKNYPEDYCQCDNASHIRRDITIEKFL